MSIHRHGPAYEEKLEARREHTRGMLRLALKVLSKAISNGGRVAVEWPREAGLWDVPEWQQFEAEPF